LLGFGPRLASGLGAALVRRSGRGASAGRF
jgi:hypothetical protein